MRKIYSLMLIAAGLLIGTQVWAQTNVCELTINGGSPTAYTNIEDAIIAVVNAAAGKNYTSEADSTSATIKLVDHATVAYKDGMTVVGHNSKDGVTLHAAEWDKDNNCIRTDRIGLDHGERITIDLNGFTLTSTLRFNLHHASLYIVGKEGSTLNTTAISQFITAYGDNSNMGAPYTYCHVIIGENVIWNGPQSTDTYEEYYALCMYYLNSYDKISDVHAYGGIRMDVYGQIYADVAAGTSGNMQVRNRDDYGTEKPDVNIPIVNIHKTAKLVGYHGLTKIAPEKLDTKPSGLNQTLREYIQTMHPTINPAGYENTGAAIYAPGYCKLNIQGYVEGGVGIYAKAGYLNLDGAIVKATAARYWPPVPNGNGFYGAGSAIVLDSHVGYGAFPGVTIQNSIITSDAGYAIEEAATSGQTKLPDINVESGVFNGEKGSIETTPEERAKLTEETEGGIQGGEWHNTDINAYINEEINQTLVYFDADHKEYKIVVPKVFPTTNSLIGDTVKLSNGNEYTIENEEKTISGMLFLTGSSKIIVKKDGVLNVGTLIISNGEITDLSSVTVEPGGKLFVTGNQGVFSRDAECIIIEADATGNGLFLIAPEIIVNTHPLATVEYYAPMIGTHDGETYWERFGLPVNHATSFAKSNTATTDIKKWVYSGAGYWQSTTGLGELNAFTGYTISHVDDFDPQNPVGITYTFKGDLVGNASSKINFFATGYNFFANSYVAPASAKDMLASISTNSQVEGSIWIWDSEKQQCNVTTVKDAMEGNGDFATVKPMQTFILHRLSNTAAVVDIDYTNAVWKFNKDVPTPVVARKMNGNADTYAKVIITAANGQSDRMSLREGNDYSDAFDNGAEATKIMSERNINLYTTTDFAEMASVATDNILGTALNLQTRNEINYTMSFSNVRGEQYAIQDVETGVITNIEEGATYDFVAPANETIEGRFVVVASRTTPTNLQNAHVGANVMKTMQNGRLMIIKNGRCFDAMGATIK